MKRQIFAVVLVAAMSIVLSGGECAGGSNSDFYSASLRPGHEVPPVADAGQNGDASVYLSEGDRSMTVTITTNINSPGKLTAAHLHLGAAGTNGGVLFDIGGPDGTRFSRTRAAEDMNAVGTVDTWEEFLVELKAGNVYVNVHTTDNPAGEIRGQLGRS
jgi:hypothetical protein